MSDKTRQSMSDKVGAAMKPDQQKGVVEQATDSVKGMADSAASTMQPESQKSATQKMTDTVSGNSNENSGSLLDSAKNAMGLGDKKN